MLLNFFSFKMVKFELKIFKKISNKEDKSYSLLTLDDGFESGRGRLNCTSNNKGNWHWFGYQFLIK